MNGRMGGFPNREVVLARLESFGKSIGEEIRQALLDLANEKFGPVTFVEIINERFVEAGSVLDAKLARELIDTLVDDRKFKELAIRFAGALLS
jgi:hypothetical protein